MRLQAAILLVTPLLLTEGALTLSAQNILPAPAESLAYDSSHVSAYSTPRLIALLSGPAWDLNWRVFHSDSVVEELVRRRPYRDLITAYGQTESDQVAAAWIARVLARMRSPASDSGLALYTGGAETDYRTYYALKYFAVLGDSGALGVLNCHYYMYNVPSAEFAEVARLFGKFRFRAAAWNLVYSIDAASGDLGEGSLDALQGLFPNARPPARHGLVDFWTAYVRQHAPETLTSAPHCVQAPSDF